MLTNRSRIQGFYGSVTELWTCNTLGKYIQTDDQGNNTESYYSGSYDDF